MQELIDAISQKVGISQECAQLAITRILGLLGKYAGESEIIQLIEKIPDAEQYLSAERAASVKAPATNAGLFGGLMGMLSSGGDIMNTVNMLKQDGMSLHDVKVVASEISSFARTNAGDELVDRILNKVPGLANFI